MVKAFEGIRVVELAQVISGPFAAGMLGFLGAEVIKVEPPGEGDQARRLIDHGPLAAAGVSPLFQGFNAGKRSITLNLKHPKAGEILSKLVESADVVIENARPGTMERLGFGYEALRAVKPDIVYCSISGYGQSGPRSGAAAYDGAVQAASGMMSITGNPGDGPMRVGFTVIDNATALTAAFAISSALFRRSQTGEGQYLDVSMLDTAFSIMSPVITGYLIGGSEPIQNGNNSLTRQPTANVFPTGNGALQINAITQTQIAALCRVVGHPDLVEDERFATARQRVAHADELRAALVNALEARTAAEWEQELAAANVPVSRVLTVPEALADPQVEHREILLRLPPPEGVEGPPSTIVNVGFMANSDGPSADTPCPLLGAETEEILGELGYGAETIERLRGDGVI